jgi:hypothetical protein
VNISDVWVPVAGSLTRRVAGAGVTSWASAVVENATSQTLYVAQGDLPPAGAVDAYWIVAPGALVTVPLGAAAVSYRLAAVPTVGGHVQTILTEEPASPGGSTGQVNIASGTVTLTGPTDVNIANVPTVDVSGPVAISSGTVNVQTGAGVSIGVAPVETWIQTMTVPAVAAGSYPNVPIPNGTASLIFDWAGANPLKLTVVGAWSGARYIVQVLDGFSVVRCPFDWQVDDHVNITAQNFVAAGVPSDLQLTASTAPVSLASVDLYPYSDLAARQYGVKNIYTMDVSGKRLFTAAIAAAGAVNLIPAAAGTAWGGYTFMAIPDAAVAGSYLQLNTPAAMLLPAAGGPFPIGFDFRGAVVANTGAALTMQEVGPAATWRVTITAAPIVT